MNYGTCFFAFDFHIINQALVATFYPILGLFVLAQPFITKGEGAGTAGIGCIISFCKTGYGISQSFKLFFCKMGFQKLFYAHVLFQFCKARFEDIPTFHKTKSATEFSTIGVPKAAFTLNTFNTSFFKQAKCYGQVAMYELSTQFYRCRKRFIVKGMYAAAYILIGFEHYYFLPRPAQCKRCHKPRSSGAHYNYISLNHDLCQLLLHLFYFGHHAFKQLLYRCLKCVGRRRTSAARTFELQCYNPIFKRLEKYEAAVVFYSWLYVCFNGINNLLLGFVGRFGMYYKLVLYRWLFFIQRTTVFIHCISIPYLSTTKYKLFNVIAHIKYYLIPHGLVVLQHCNKIGCYVYTFYKGQVEQLNSHWRRSGSIAGHKLELHTVGYQEPVGHKLHSHRIGRHFGIYREDLGCCHVNC